MASYQNIFTQVQVRGPAELGVPLPKGSLERDGKGFIGISRFMGAFGNAQIGPIYLGWSGVGSLLCFFIALEIIGWNMAASVNWDPIEFIRQLPWLTLNPPPPEQGFNLFPPLNQGGWFVLTGFFFTMAMALWLVRT